MTEDLTALGRIITFYSYKGGTGRSMALANTACWLASKGTPASRKVLVMDWDLEAPGLHRFFADRAELPENRDRGGIINYFDALEKMLKVDQSLYTRLQSEDGPELLADLLEMDDYTISDVITGVDLIKAGKLDTEYAELISRFNWANFYNQYGTVIDLFRNLLASKYDYVLIDSRTGFTDISGICTMLLPEKLVAVFTPNKQSLSGVLDLVKRATAYRRLSNDFRPLSVFPLPSRIETAEQDLKREWRKQYQQEFEGAFLNIYQLENCDLTTYFDEVQLPHVAYYAYGENIALLKERSDALSLSRAYQGFCQRLIGLDFPWDTVAEEESKLTVPTTAKFERQEFDIFISYSHIDNENFEGSEGWVDLLHNRLDRRLTQLIGEPQKIWRERKLLGNDIFESTRLLQISKSTILVVILSPRYLKSEWCLRELEEFGRSAELQGGLIVGGKSRLIKVVKTFIPRERVPLQLQGLLGYEFYEWDEVSGRAREFSPEIVPNRDARYWEKLEDLAWDLKQQIESLSGAEYNPLSTPDSQEAQSSVIYVAEATSDLSDQRDKIKRELQQQGHQVLPDKPLPLSIPAIEEAIREYLKRSRLSVHMVGENYGIIPEMETDRSIARLQLELAMERGDDTEFSSLIWIPPGLQPRDRLQQRFVDDLQNTFTSHNDSEVLQVRLEDLKTIIQSKLAQKPKVASTESDAARSAHVYLICDRQDSDAVKPLLNYLFERGCEVTLPPLEGTEAEVLQDHKENLLLCDAILIYQGRTTEGWLRLKLRELLKLPGYGRTTPLLSKAVYVGGPELPTKERFKTLEALVIKNYGEFDPVALEPFLAQISKAKERSL